MILILVAIWAIPAVLHAEDWTEDFNRQVVANRPVIEVRYVTSARTAFEVIADQYHVVGSLRKPHQLKDAQTNANWLTLALVDDAGVVYSGQFANPASKINNYRHGTYFYETHWLDYQFSTEQGTLAPIKGDVALFCYPEKILVRVQLIATAAFNAQSLRITGLSNTDFPLNDFAANARQNVAFPLFGETPPLPPAALTTISAAKPLAYDAERGCYTIGSNKPGGDDFYEVPNKYESVSFKINNDATRRKIYVLHRNAQNQGNFNGSVVRDAEGHPLPLQLQMCKNFKGEYEEPIYNPDDTGFCELYYPLYLEPNEEVTLTSQHLRQNWGRTMTKHHSSLGFFMGYFQSSTGITETTCYVPYKYFGTQGIQIADFRAMSQDHYWTSQPQHDNVAGHSIMSYYTNNAWANTEYRSVVPYFTGNHQYDIDLEYLTTDNKIEIKWRTFEYPQEGELRTFFRMDAKVLQPLTIADPEKNFRILEIAGRFQNLHYTELHTSGNPSQAIAYNAGNFPIQPQPLASQSSWMDWTGDDSGSNAIFIRRFTSSKPMSLCANVQIGKYKSRMSADRDTDIRPFLSVRGSNLQLNTGDTFSMEGYFCPNGHIDNADFAQQERPDWSVTPPYVDSVEVGSRLNDFPVQIQSNGTEAIFTIAGGREMITVAVHGFSSYLNPQIYRRGLNGDWIPLANNRLDAFDGGWVFAEGNGRFGATFPVNIDGKPLTLKATMGEPASLPQRLALTALPSNPGQRMQLTIPETSKKLELQFENSLDLLGAPLADPHTPSNWTGSLGGSFYTKTSTAQQSYGAYVIPDTDSLRFQTWWMPLQSQTVMHSSTRLTLRMAGSGLLDAADSHILGYRNGKWTILGEETAGAVAYAVGSAEPAPDFGAIAMRVPSSNTIVALAYQDGRQVTVNRALQTVSLDLDAVGGDAGRYVTRGKFYVFQGSLDDLARAIALDFQAPYEGPHSGVTASWLHLSSNMQEDQL